MSDGGEPILATGTSGSREPGSTAVDGLDADTHRALGKALYNRVWTLLESSDRTAGQVDEMLYASHASAYHWSNGGGTLANRARGEWQIARALIEQDLGSVPA